jgi:hypothetical protein
MVNDWVTVFPTSMAPKLLLSGEMVIDPPSQIPLLVQVGALLGQPDLPSVQQVELLMHVFPHRLWLLAQHNSFEQFPEEHSVETAQANPFAFFVPQVPLIQK